LCAAIACALQLDKTDDVTVAAQAKAEQRTRTPELDQEVRNADCQSLSARSFAKVFHLQRKRECLCKRHKQPAGLVVASFATASDSDESATTKRVSKAQPQHLGTWISKG